VIEDEAEASGYQLHGHLIETIAEFTISGPGQSARDAAPHLATWSAAPRKTTASSRISPNTRIGVHQAPQSGHPAARVKQYNTRKDLYEAVERLILEAEHTVYDTSWGLIPNALNVRDDAVYQKQYRNAIYQICSTREVAREIIKRLDTSSMKGSYEPRLVKLPPEFPMLEFLVVDATKAVVSGIGADRNVFLLVEGGTFPALLSDYLSTVWNDGTESLGAG